MTDLEHKLIDVIVDMTEANASYRRTADALTGRTKELEGERDTLHAEASRLRKELAEAKSSDEVAALERQLADIRGAAPNDSHDAALLRIRTLNHEAQGLRSVLDLTRKERDSARDDLVAAWEALDRAQVRADSVAEGINHIAAQPKPRTVGLHRDMNGAVVGRAYRVSVDVDLCGMSRDMADRVMQDLTAALKSHAKARLSEKAGSQGWGADKRTYDVLVGLAHPPTAGDE